MLLCHRQWPFLGPLDSNSGINRRKLTKRRFHADNFNKIERWTARPGQYWVSRYITRTASPDARDAFFLETHIAHMYSVRQGYLTTRPPHGHFNATPVWNYWITVCNLGNLNIYGGLATFTASHETLHSQA
jgi:hypothetical protein